ncbi:MAG TPA: ABC transporter ATP-binding protein [Phycisphaerales bacterium]|nr:ABC transporter ATP-binding protein [Phycisphaerales bacterium]
MLAASDVHFSYPRRTVLQGVTAEFPAGVVTALIGPNGAGKSTLLRLLLGLVRPADGRVTLGERAVASIPDRERAKLMAYVPQHSQVAFPFTAAEVVRLGRYGAGEGGADALVPQALAKLDIADRAGDLFGQLSAGQQQRVTVARALAQLEGHPGPQYLIADEPVSAMDPSHALRTMDVLRDLAAKGSGVVVVLHDLSLVTRYANRVVVLDSSGRVAAGGPTRDVLTPELLQRVYGVTFQRLIDPAAPDHPGVLVPARPV